MKDVHRPFNERKEVAPTLEYYFDMFSHPLYSMHNSPKVAGNNTYDHKEKLIPKLKFNTHIGHKDIIKKLQMFNEMNLEKTGELLLLKQKKENIKKLLNQIINVKKNKNLHVDDIEDTINHRSFNFDDKNTFVCLNSEFEKISINKTKMTTLSYNKQNTMSNNSIEFNTDKPFSFNKSHTSIFPLTKINNSKQNKSTAIDYHQRLILKKESVQSITKLLPLNDNPPTIITTHDLLKKPGKNLIKTNTASLLKNCNSIVKNNPYLQKGLFSNYFTNNYAQWKEKEYRQLRNDKHAVYDSQSDDEDVMEEISQSFNPESKEVILWDIWILIILIYCVTLIPFSIAFFNLSCQIFTILDYIVNISLIGDIVFNFYIAFPSEDSDEYIFLKKAIALNYIKGWLFIDCLAAFPFASIINNYNNKRKRLWLSQGQINTPQPYMLLKLFPLLKIIKKLIHDKTKKKTSHDEIIFSMIPENIKRIFFFFFFLILLTHVLSCIWSFIGFLNNPSWITTYNIQDSSNIDIYFCSLYFNIATIFAIGYGDITSVNSYERSYNSFLMIIGLLMYTFIVSSIMILFKKTNKKIKLERDISLLDHIKIKYDVNSYLYWRIRRFITYESETNQDDKINLLHEFSHTIRNILIQEMYSEIFNFKFFNETNIIFKTKVIMNLKPLFSTKKDILVQSSHMIEELIFVKRGRLELEYCYQNHIIKISQIYRGENFGEINMLLNKKSNYDIVVKTKIAELLLLDKHHLIQICNEFPDFLMNIKQKSLLNYNLFAQKLNMKIAEINAFALKEKEEEATAQNLQNFFIEDYENIENDLKASHLNINEQQIIGTIVEVEEDDVNNSENSFPKLILTKTGTKEDQKMILNTNYSTEIKKYDQSSLSHLFSLNSNTFEHVKTKTTIKMNSTLPPLITSERHIPKKSLQSSSLNIFNSATNDKTKPQLSNYVKQNSLNMLSLPGLSKQRLSLFISPKKRQSTNYTSSVVRNQALLGRDDDEGKTPQKRGRLSISNNSLCSINGLNSTGKRTSIISKNKIERHTNRMSQNIYEGSMKINDPQGFYSSVFEKWKMEEQIKRMHKLYKHLNQFFNQK